VEGAEVVNVASLGSTRPTSTYPRQSTRQHSLESETSDDLVSPVRARGADSRSRWSTLSDGRVTLGEPETTELS